MQKQKHHNDRSGASPISTHPCGTGFMQGKLEACILNTFQQFQSGFRHIGCQTDATCARQSRVMLVHETNRELRPTESVQYDHKLIQCNMSPRGRPIQIGASFSLACIIVSLTTGPVRRRGLCVNAGKYTLGCTALLRAWFLTGRVSGKH